MNKVSSDLYIRFHHKDINNLSDKTLRQLIREFSKITNEILKEEIDYILLGSDIPYRVKQSIRDRLNAKNADIPKFYVEQIEKGSFTLFVLVPAAMIFTVGTIVLACVNEFKKGQPTISEDEAIAILEKSKKHLENRSDIIIDDILPKYENKELGNRFVLNEFTVVEDEQGRKIAEANISSTVDDHEINSEKIDNAFAEKFLTDATGKVTKKRK